MKRLAAVFAHPDDEGLIAGALAHYASSGVQVSLICTTKGEAGEISDDALATNDNLGAIREAELRCACEVIGISDLHLLGYCDSGMDGTPENNKPTAFIQADPDEVRYKLVDLFRSIKPHVVVTFEPFGWYGHPDHIAAGRYATEAFTLCQEPEAYPEAGSAWKPDRLYHAVLLPSIFKEIMDYARSQGWELDDLESDVWQQADSLEPQITHIFDASSYADLKDRSMRCHRTQFGQDHLFYRVPSELMRKAHSNEYFIQVEPLPGQLNGPVSDLFEGVKIQPERV